jgi:ribonucleoside-diphosphate reductase alpha chain
MSNDFTVTQLMETALNYFSGDTLAADVWAKKYALKKNGKWEEGHPTETIQRIVNELSRMENTFPNPLSKEIIQDHLEHFKHFIPGGSILFGLGNPNQISSLGNCFFIHNGADSYGGIFNIDESMVQLMKRRGGVGITLENLRPLNAIVNNAAQSSTGAVSFMDRFSGSTREVAQDGRRGALMISLLVSHPSIREFIMKKDNIEVCIGANISVKITNEFMKACETNEDFILRWPVTKKQPIIEEQLVYNKLYKRDDGSYIMKVKAKEIWDLIIKQAHKNAEPGVLFWDNIIKESPADCYSGDGFETLGVNPCAELPLSAHDSCRLGSINLNNMVIKPYTESAKIDYTLLAEVSRLSQRLMDDIVSLEEEKVKAIISKIKSDPEDPELKKTELNLWKKILEILLKGRRTGIGVLGFADMLAKIGIRYGTKEATKIADKIFKIIAVNSYRESVQLAKERGCFPVWNSDKEAQNPYIIRVISNNFDNEEYADYMKYGRRNIANLAIAPNGSLGILARTTSGIEPVFKIYYKRRRKINPNESGVKVDYKDDNGDCWQEYNVFHPEFINWVKNTNVHLFENFQNKSLDEIIKMLESLPDETITKLVAESPWAGSESYNIDYLEKITMQGVIQKWIDNSISITHNLPANISLEEVNKIYFHAWKSGCKGCTIYREGSRQGVLITRKEDDEFTEINAPKRAKELKADYYVATANGVKYAVIVGLWKNTNKPYEIFAFENPPMDKNTHGAIIKVKKGHYKFVNGEFEIDNIQLAADKIEQKAHTIFLSMLLRHRAPIVHICNVAKKVDENITSFSSACRRVLSRYIETETLNEKCPTCNSSLVREEGCVHCSQCEYSKCG